MRDITIVIAYLCQEVIPPSEIIAISSIKALAQRAMYTPPEGQVSNWNELALYLYSEFGEPDNDWKRRVKAVMNDEIKIPADFKPKV